jgi:hypothetical protein
VRPTATLQTRSPSLRRGAVAALALIHVLGALGAPFAAEIHLFQPGATAHQNFHVVWEAFKYFAASVLALGVTLGPLARGERWAWWAMVVASATLFGGVFLADAVTGGAPSIDHWAYGTFLVISAVALAVLARPPAEAWESGAEGAPGH